MRSQARNLIKQRLEAMRLNCIFKEPYKSAERWSDSENQKVAKLNLNENFFIPREKLLKLIIEILEDLDPRLYPQDEGERLRERIGEYVGFPADNIVVCNGGDESLERIAHLFLEKGEEAITISPTFSMYRFAVSLQRAKLVEVPLKRDFSLDVDGLLSNVTPKTKVLFLCSPNNPTANQFRIDEISILSESFPGVVVVDEAYVEFADYSAASLIKKYENLIVVRTFSKAFGLAGLRLGYCIADAEVAKALSECVSPPFSVNTVSLKVGAKILGNKAIFEEATRKVRAERERLVKALNGINGVEAFDSKANFVLFKTEKPLDIVYNNLLQRGVLVRKIGNVLGFQNCFRATVGLPWMNAKLIDALKEICS
ncbi:MAG: histidinol-phosphate transaminase [Candidatus Bathyarchaeia archaeon]